jgi:hypothetical protein
LGDVVDLASGERVTATLLETFSRRDAADGQSKMYGRFRDSRGTIREWRLDDPPEVLRIRRSASAGKGGENP